MDIQWFFWRVLFPPLTGVIVALAGKVLFKDKSIQFWGGLGLAIVVGCGILANMR